MTGSFDELVDAGGLSPDERRRLEQVHEMLVAAGTASRSAGGTAGAAGTGRPRRPDSSTRTWCRFPPGARGDAGRPGR